MSQIGLAIKKILTPLKILTQRQKTTQTVSSAIIQHKPHESEFYSFSESAFTFRLLENVNKIVSLSNWLRK